MAAIITFMSLMVCFMISFCCHGLFLIILPVRVSFFFSGELMELVLCTPGQIGGRLIQTASHPGEGSLDYTERRLALQPYALF